MRLCRGVAIVGLVTVLGGPVVAGRAAQVSAPLTGDQKGIAIAHAVLRAFSKVTSYTATEHRFVFMRARAGRHGFFDWSWGAGVAPRTWAAATEHELVVTHRGTIVWMRDNLTPDYRICSGRSCVRYPDVQVLVNRHGQYFRFAGTRCYYRLTGTVPLHAGDPAYRIQGFMLDPGRRPGEVLLNYDYQWDPLRRAGETDVISDSTGLVQSGQVDLLGYGTVPSFIFSFALKYPHTAPVAPRVRLCSS